MADQDLEQKIRKGGMTRRDFLKLSGRYAGGLGIAAGTGLLAGCNKKNGNPIGPTNPRYRLNIYNHTQGFLRTYDTGNLSGEFSIRITDLGVSGVDEYRWAARDPGFGALRASGKDGTIRLAMPGTETEYDLFLFNTSNEAPYQWMDEQNANFFGGSHDLIVYRKDFDGQTGPQRVWTGDNLSDYGIPAGGVFPQLNQALKPGGVPFTYGQIHAYTEEVDGARFTYGYGDSEGADGYHYETAITVNAESPNFIGAPGAMVSVGLEEAFENITKTDNIGGHSSLVTIQTEGIFNDKAIDLFTYTAAMT